LRDSYFAPPLRDFVDSLVQLGPFQQSGSDSIMHDLLLLDNRLPERQWRHAAAKPLAELLKQIEQHQLKLQHPLLDFDSALDLVAELAY